VYDEPLSRHTTFRIGGPADLFLTPETPEDLQAVLIRLNRLKIPFFIFGGGANILVSDSGVRGAAVCLSRMRGMVFHRDSVEITAGHDISEAARETAARGLSGLHVFAGMPGSTGGAVWMNARCYDGEIAPLLMWADTYSPEGQAERYIMNPDHWRYKHSPFQNSGKVIARACFRLETRDPGNLLEETDRIRRDREDKGHYRAPCAGSLFKNNRDFGEPSGKIIDKAGLRGLRVGDAAVSDWHANIFINRGNASARDMRTLIETVKERVRLETGFILEPEVVFAGDWEEHDG
jgi:UDP-N-acetylmuramate dehydrogenase